MSGDRIFIFSTFAYAEEPGDSLEPYHFLLGAAIVAPLSGLYWAAARGIGEALRRNCGWPISGPGRRSG
ncbi:MAG: hypothetical protein ACR2QK_19100 [Acidimicrobiales bacterium]